MREFLHVTFSFYYEKKKRREILIWRINCIGNAKQNDDEICYSLPSTQCKPYKGASPCRQGESFLHDISLHKLLGFLSMTMQKGA